MQWRQIAVPGAVSAAAGAASLVPGTSPGITITVVVLGAGIAGAAWTGFGGSCLLLCLGETIAVGLGTASPVPGVLFQPAIAGRVCGSDRTSLVLAGSTITMAAAGVLVFSNTLSLLLALTVLSICIALGLMGFGAWMGQRVSAGGAT